MPLPIIITTPSYTFGERLKSAAPVGISVLLGCQAYVPDPTDTPAVALVMYDVVKPCHVSKEEFVRWLLEETAKNDGCSLDYGGITIEKTASAFARVFEDMEKHKDDPSNPEDEA